MCPLYPLHLFLTYSFLLLCLWCFVGSTLSSIIPLKVKHFINGTEISLLNISEKEELQVTYYVDDIPPDVIGEIVIQETSDDGLQHLHITPEKLPIEHLYPSDSGLEGSFNVSGTLLGFSKIRLFISDGNDQELMEASPVKAEIHRGKRILDKIFIHCIILLVIISYINMGCAIDLNVIKQSIMRPVGPSIGLFCQYVFMPLAAFGIGYVLFSSTPEMWLGLFLTGCSPGGGGSNIWTYMLDGSLDLSITMTFISTVVAFGALPLWVYALGSSIFKDGTYDHLPYKNIAMLVLGLVVPCSIGLLIKHFFPKVAKWLKRMLKPLAAFFIIFVMTFGIYANLYMFSFFNWKVIIGGFCLPFLGFLFGGLASLLFRRKWEDAIAISIETGIQNTGIAIGVIKIALRDFSPLDDICIVLPVAVATMTPLPLAIVYLWKIIRKCRGKTAKTTLEGDIKEESDICILGVHSERNSYASDMKD